MTTVYILRHGQYSSPTPVIPYRMPGFHLSPEGVKQAEAVSARLASEPVRGVYASPMERTAETAAIIARPHGLTPVIDERLWEVRSPAQGKEKGFITAMGGWHMYDTPWYREHHGETLDEIYSRTQAVVDEKRREHEGGAVVLVTHGDPVMLVAAFYLHVPRTPSAMETLPYVPMAGGYTIVFDGQPSIYPIVAS